VVATLGNRAVEAEALMWRLRHQQWRLGWWRPRRRRCRPGGGGQGANMEAGAVEAKVPAVEAEPPKGGVVLDWGWWRMGRCWTGPVARAVEA
jgi:hypothetical protein